MLPSRLSLLVVVVAALGCSSGDDGTRAGQECSRGTTTAACDACAQLHCVAKYAQCFHDTRSDLGDRIGPGVCADRATCIAHCACGDDACYDACPTTTACTDCIAQLRDCEVVSCNDDCREATAGFSDACTELARCCASPRMPEGIPPSCRNAAADGRTEICASELQSYRDVDYCD